MHTNSDARGRGPAPPLPSCHSYGRGPAPPLPSCHSYGRGPAPPLPYERLFFLPADFTSFTSFAANFLASVADAFAFVGFGLANAADASGDLTDELFIDTADANFGRFSSGIDAIDGESDAVGRLNQNGMRITNLNDQGIASFVGTIANAVNLKLFGIASSDANNHIIDQRAIQAVLRSMFFAVRRTRNVEGPIFEFESQSGIDLLRQLAFGAFDRYKIVLGPVHLHLWWNGDRSASNTRHEKPPSLYQT